MASPKLFFESSKVDNLEEKKKDDKILSIKTKGEHSSDSDRPTLQERLSSRFEYQGAFYGLLSKSMRCKRKS
jgi:hypothetical protein